MTRILSGFQPGCLCFLNIPVGWTKKKHIDFDHYTVGELKQVINTEGYQKMVQSWQDERSYIQKAVDALGKSTSANEAKSVLADLVAGKPDLKGFKPFELEKGLETEHFSKRSLTLLTDQSFF